MLSSVSTADGLSRSEGLTTHRSLLTALLTLLLLLLDLNLMSWRVQISSGGEPLGPNLKLGSGRRTWQTLGLTPLLSRLTLTDIGAGLPESVLIQLGLRVLA